MKRLPIACCVFVLSQASALAQSPSLCELRVGSFSVGGSVAVQASAADIFHGNMPNGAWMEVQTRDGRSRSVEFTAPITPGWGTRVDYSHGHLAAVRSYSTVTPYSQIEERQGEVTVRHLTAAIVHAVSPQRGPCAYVGGGAGLYDFNYFGQRARNRGVFGLVGIEFGVGERSGLAFEIQLHAANHGYEGPLRSETVLMLKPGVAFRVHF